MIEMFKTRNGLNPSFMREIFCPQNNQYNLRNDHAFDIPKVRSVTYESETVRFRGSQGVHLHYQLDSQLIWLNFEAIIKAWKADECQLQCRPCSTFLPLLGFI